MSANGDAIGMGILTGQASGTSAFIAAKRGSALTTVDSAQLLILRAKAEGNAIDQGIQSALANIQPGAGLAVVAAVAVAAGQPIYVDPTSGQLKLASAATFPASIVAGLVQAATLATFAAPVATTTLTLSDWTAAVGSVALAKGARYFLGTTPGTLALTAPTTPGQSVVSVGIALSTTQLEIAPTSPILL